MVGAWRANNLGGNQGAAYVIFGSNSGLGTIDLSTPLTITQGFKIQGARGGDMAGWSVSSAGDINGDGFDDLMVGAPQANAAYVILGGAFGKTVTTTGTAAAEMLIGSANADTLTGNGGADIFRGGAGNDTLTVTGNNFADIDGGNGDDILRIDGVSDVFDFNIILPGKVHSIEAIDMTATGNQTLVLGNLDVFNLSDDTALGVTTLTVYGTAGPLGITGQGGDIVDIDLSAWTKGSTPTAPDADNNVFDIYTHGNARLLIDQDILVM